jgi:hypothetical protein
VVAVRDVEHVKNHPEDDKKRRRSNYEMRHLSREQIRLGVPRTHEANMLIGVGSRRRSAS